MTQAGYWATQPAVTDGFIWRNQKLLRAFRVVAERRSQDSEQTLRRREGRSNIHSLPIADRLTVSKKHFALLIGACFGLAALGTIYGLVLMQRAQSAESATSELLRADAQVSDVALRLWHGQDPDAAHLLAITRELPRHLPALSTWQAPASLDTERRELETHVVNKLRLAERFGEASEHQAQSRRALQRLLRRLSAAPCGPLTAEVVATGRISLTEPLDRSEVARLEPKLQRLENILSESTSRCQATLSEAVNHAQVVALGRRDAEGWLDELLEQPVAASGARVLALTRQVAQDRARLSLLGALASAGFGLMLCGLVVVAHVRIREQSLRHARDNQRLEQQNDQLGGVNQDLADALQASKDAMKAKYQFLANISHELRTPLNGITGSLDLIADEPLSSSQDELMGVARRSARELLGLVDRLFHITEDADRSLATNREVFELSELLDGIDDTFGRAARAKGLIFSVHADSQLPVRWKADLERLRQVLENLVENAIKFTDTGFVKLTVEAADPQQERLRFDVIDSGLGIDPKDHEAIFESFFQVTGNKNRRAPGAGLGLALCRRHALALAGTVGVESQPGRGSRFRFEVPMQPAPIQQSGSTERPASSSKPRQRILVVEDDAVNQQVIQRMLEKRRLDVVIAKDGLEALAAVEQARFDLILMDLQMPKMDGLEATTRIRERDRATSRDVPIVALTANVSEQDRSDCERAGMNEFLCKPITGRQLDAKLRQLLRRVQVAGDSAQSA